MYNEDSFFTLSIPGQIGLVVLSRGLMLLCLWLAHVLGRGRRRALRLWLAFIIFWAFLWLSPQAYYAYYMTLFDGLPLQNVIKSPPGLSTIVSLLTFTDAPNLSNHGKGVLGWVLLAVGAFGHRT